MGVAGTSLGGRLSRHRRNRIRYLALARRSNSYTMHAWYIRVMALVIIAGLSIGSRSSLLAIGLRLVASFGSFLWINERHLRRGTQPRFLVVALCSKRDQNRWFAPAEPWLVLRDSRSLRLDRDPLLDSDR